MKYKRFMTLFACLLALMLLCSCSSEDDDDDNDNDAGDDDTGDDDDDSQPPAPCEEGLVFCSGDGYEIWTCTEGEFVVTDCSRQGKLCEDGGCVEPWNYGNPVFDQCAAVEHATEETLAEKAAYYDRLAAELHIHPEQMRLNSVTLKEGATEDTATWQDVETWHTGENDGLWTGTYIAAEAFRYAVTRDEEALDVLRVLMNGMVKGTRITGKAGLYTREYITPGISGMSCPSNPDEYIPDVEKDDNQWVKVDDDGAILTYDGSEWVRNDYFVPVEYAGHCWLDNVSQDEYAGHMLGAGVVARIVDDPEVQATAALLLEESSAHLMENAMQYVDWDGRVTEHGRIHPWALDNFPGFNAILGMDWVLMGAEVSGRQDLRNYYDICLLQKGPEPVNCLQHAFSPPITFTRWLNLIGIYVGGGACLSNWNNMNMSLLSIFTLIWYELDPLVREQLQYALEFHMIQEDDNTRDILKQHNALFNYIFASMKRVGPFSTGPAYDAVQDANCVMRQFPASKAVPTIQNTEEEYPTDMSCESRFEGRFLTFDPVPIWDRCPGIFNWTRNPYRQSSCTENDRKIIAPADYLLAYWMGRYFGFIEEES